MGGENPYACFLSPPYEGGVGGGSYKRSAPSPLTGEGRGEGEIPIAFLFPTPYSLQINNQLPQLQTQQHHINL
jgi:hypothetical protein